MRWVAGDRAIAGSAASAGQMGRFETKWLSRPENLAALAELPSRWIDKCTSGNRRRSSCSTWIRARARPMASRNAVPIMAISAAPAMIRCPCSNQFGDVQRVRAEAGNMHSRWLARGAGAGGCSLPAHRKASVFPGRRSLRQSRDIRVPRSRRHGVCDPPAG
jgi:hypothetical protein